MQKKSTGQLTHQHQGHAPLSLAQVAEAINDADAGIEALIELLTKACEPVAPAGIARLLRPHHEALRRAAEVLTDQT